MQLYVTANLFTIITVCISFCKMCIQNIVQDGVIGIFVLAQSIVTKQVNLGNI